MSYTRTNWVNNSRPPINQSNLNNIESGLQRMHALEDFTTSSISTNRSKLDNTDNVTAASNSKANNANTKSAQAEDISILANAKSSSATQNSVLANNNSNYANKVISDNNIYGFPGELIHICEVRLCKPITDEDNACFYYEGQLIIGPHTLFDSEEPIIVEEPEDPGGLLG